jgi:penicillin amidase
LQIFFHRSLFINLKPMRKVFGVILLLLAITIVFILDRPLGALPAIGRLIDPINGCWANAESVNKNFSENLKFSGIKGTGTVWYDDRMVPHIHAANEHDLFFMEGYIHASFRLWQMDMQTRAAAGRISEVIGDKGLAYDRKQRFKGMGYAAENSLKAMEADPRTRQMMDSYTEGINTYISSLSYRTYPFEYKLMGFAPEPWTNLKIALLLKYMADDLTGATNDIALTYLRDVLPKAELDMLFPDKVAGSTPVVPAGTTFDRPTLAIPVAPADSVAFPHFKPTDFGVQREDGKGSNNWAVSGAKTASGTAILCNDPHLMLNLPSVWYEVQLQAPGQNVYGASMPGAPGIIIGFNDSLAWGVTNNYRDVKDFYLIKPVAGNSDKYWFAGKQLDYVKRVEHIKVKNNPDVVDTVNYTVHGPVTFEGQNAKEGGLRKPLAMCWMGHKATNEILAIYLLNKAGNYNQFVDAIINFQCPAQNFAYADHAGNIAIWGQGQFVNKWKDQGRYVMEGSDSATLWQQLIPMRENPHVLNPAQGYLCSANQATTDSSYPYQYNGAGWVNFRAWRINEVLAGLQKATIKDMFALQNDTYSILAAKSLPVMLKYLPAQAGEKESSYLNSLKKWDYNLKAESIEATIYQVWWSFLYRDIWQAKFWRVPNQFLPLQEQTILSFPGAPAAGNAMATVAGTNIDFVKVLQQSFKEAMDSLKNMQHLQSTPIQNSSNPMEWYYAKNTSVKHLTKLPALSYDHLKIGGWGNTVNAAKGDHGPSWRMVVQMGKQIEAYGVYPGGQSGNPGSKYYANFLQSWVDGTYYRLAFLPNADKQNDTAIKYIWTIKG